MITHFKFFERLESIFTGVDIPDFAGEDIRLLIRLKLRGGPLLAHRVCLLEARCEP
jgi:hypothetical protein